MSYQTLLYLCLFLPFVLLIYQLCSRNHRRLWLLVSSWFFFFLISRHLVLLLIGTTFFVFWIAKRIDKAGSKKGRRFWLWTGLIFIFGLLILTKYLGFLVKNASAFSFLLGGRTFAVPHIIVPIGISYYSLEAAGYLLEVYWKRMPADPSFTRVALFLSFFPQTMEGPIARYQDTADQLSEGKSIRFTNLQRGFVRILYGLFKKVVIADRLSVPVGTLFDAYEQYHGLMIVAAAVFYTLQLYMEFSGGIDIILGSAELFGISLPENFRQPFFAHGPAEFWRRWHISLGTWLKTYIFYPVSTSRGVKRWNKFARKKLGKYLAKVGVSALSLFPVWLFNGIWHGPQWNYIFYGMYYFVILLLEVMMDPLRNAIKKKAKARSLKVLTGSVELLITWIIIFTGELFFRANGLKAGMRMFVRIFRGFTLRPLFDGSFLQLGMKKEDILVIIAGCLLVFIIDLLQEMKVNLREVILNQKLPIRWAFLYGLIFLIVIFGAYGSGYQAADLIYAGF